MAEKAIFYSELALECQPMRKWKYKPKKFHMYIYFSGDIALTVVTSSRIHNTSYLMAWYTRDVYL